ncbi:GGDEF domain-containing protein [Demequina iriomotensis]|uniref:GGDEF domain-containing protein n=1 Tax=Demequina iriomotensis TaxID=1536641 RepID=UPI0007863322|nr:GGDEF domain-containing protein [Demequina iriomotensis]
MIDPTSVRVALAVVVALSLFHVVGTVARVWTSSAPRWWGAALGLTVASLAFDLGNGTPVQWLTVPVGNAIGVASVLCVLYAVRAIRGRTPPWVASAFALVGTVASAAVERPMDDAWAGSTFMFAVLAGAYGLIAAETWSALRALGPDRLTTRRVEARAFTAFTLAAEVLAALYLARWVSVLLEGRDDSVFGTSAGMALTGLVQIGGVAAVTFSLGSLGELRRRDRLERRATTDHLTGVLSRGELMSRLESRLAAEPVAGDVIVMCDLDGFKEINDRWGHGAGDRALVAFTEAWGGLLGPADVFGRLGGDEFVLLLSAVGLDGARARVGAVPPLLDAAAADHVTLVPAASYGLAAVEPRTSPEVLLGRADMALYEAKAAGGGTMRVYGRPLAQAAGEAL